MITNLQANRILDFNFGASSYSATSPLYIGLSTTSINNDGTGYTEPSGNAYARVSVTNNKTTWTTASGSSLSNAIQVSFPESSGSWGTITHIFIADALSGGAVLFFDALTSSRTVPANTTVYFAIGNITVSMPNT
jgi:hypothetical protein